MEKMTIKKVEWKLVEISSKAILAEGKNKHENLLANATVTFKLETGEHFTITGFSIWKSQYNGKPNAQMPQKNRYKFFLCEKSLWRKIERVILDAYDFATIEIVKDEIDVNDIL